MDHEKLIAAQRRFLAKYPGGFEHPELQLIGKKHKMDQRVAFARQNLTKKSFEDPETVVDAITKLVTGSSMVSLFEKPRFREATQHLSGKERAAVADAYRELLHGKEADGFSAVAEFLQRNNVAKWPVATVIPCYYRPQKDVLIKPTTAKLIISELQLPIKYGPRLSWEFYSAYRKLLSQLRKACDPSLAPSNAAFSGFLMMSLGQDT